MGIFNSGPAPMCPALPTPLNDISPIAGSLTLHRLSMYIAGISMGVAVLISATLIFLHATHLSRPAEQIKIIRITALIPTFALIYFINIYLGVSAVYLVPWGKACEAISLASFFFLVCDYLFPSPNGSDGTGQSFEVIENNPKLGGAAVDLNGISRTRTLVCQYIGVATLVALVTDITQATGYFCRNSNSIHFAHIWLTILHAISAAVAIIAIIKFTKQMHPRLHHQRIVSKLVAFKLIVGLDFVQTLAFSIAGARFHASSKLSYLGLTVYLPAIIFCAEMTIFSLLFHFVYSYRPYITNRSAGLAYRGGPMGILAIGKALNPVDIFGEIVYRF